MIAWPAVIYYQGDDELLYLSDGKAWSADPDVHCHPFSDGDTMIDSNGEIHALLYSNENRKVEIKNTGKTLGLDEFEVLVKKHLSLAGQCCVEKLAIKTFSEGIQLVSEADD